MNCKICQAQTSEIYLEKTQTLYFYCDNCEFIFIDPQKILEPSIEVTKYDEHNNSLECEGYVKMFHNFIDNAIKPFIKDVGVSLDFGSGPGPVLSILLNRQGWDSKIYDPFYAKKSDYTNYDYDLITSTEVFEHFSEPIQEIEHIISLLKPGGLLSIMTLFHTNNQEDFINWWYHRDPTHISFYTLKTFEYIAKTYGLEIIYTDNKRSITFRKK